MRNYILRRLVGTFFSVIGVSIVVFMLMRMVPGTIIDALLGMFSSRDPQLISAMRAYFGLDQPLFVQYIRYVGDLLQGHLGTSWRAGQPISELIAASLPVTLELSLLAMFITVFIGVPLGVVSAVKANGLIDNLGRLFSFASLGMPNFWQAAIIILLCSKVFHWMPPLQYVSIFKNPIANLQLLILPALTLGTVNVANIMRLTRSSMLEEFPKDYIRTARSKGIKERAVVLGHALRNSLINVVTVLGLMTGYLLGGAVTVEAVFDLPGIGRLILWSIYQRDYPVTQTVLLLTCTLFIVVNFLVDILYAYISPQIRYE